MFNLHMLVMVINSWLMQSANLNGLENEELNRASQGNSYQPKKEEHQIEEYTASHRYSIYLLLAHIVSSELRVQCNTRCQQCL